MLEVRTDLCFKELNDFFNYCETVKNASEHTLYNYFRDLLLFFRYMKFIKNKAGAGQKITEISITDINIDFIEKININDIYRYFDYLKISRNNSQRTIIRRSVSLKKFFKYLHLTMELIENDPTEKLEFKAAKTEPVRFMDEKDCITLLNSISGKNMERDYCILVIFINCGIRLSELVQLNDTDIKPDGTVTIKNRNTSRTIFFNSVCMEALEEYNNFKVNFFKGKRYDHHAVFLGHGGKRLTGRWIEEIVKKRMKNAGFGDKGLSPNKLRHTSAIIMYRRGIDVDVMKDILGHKEMSSMQVYINPQPSQIETAMKNNSVSRKKK